MDLRVSQIIAERSGIDIMDCYGETTLAHYLDLVEDIGMDSFCIIEMIVQLEQEYNIEISDIDAAEMKTVGDVLKYLRLKTKKPRGCE